MKINFNVPFESLDGPLEESPLNKLIANAISAQPEGPPAKINDWARALWKGEEIEVDRNDEPLLTSLITKSNTIIVLVKDQALSIIEKAKKE